MLILSFLWGLLELGIVGITLFYVWIDYRRGFPSIRQAIERLYELGQRLFHLNKDEKKRAEVIVRSFGKHLAIIREAVATLQANYEVAARHAKEQDKLATDFRQLGEENLRHGDEDTGFAAATAAAEARKRMQMYEETAQQQLIAAEELQRQLDREELHFGAVETQAETIYLNNAIAEAKNQLYELLSDVEAKTGLTVHGTLAHLLESSERNRIKSGKLLDLVRHSSNGKMRDMIINNEAHMELEAMRQRIALPEGISHENGLAKIEPAANDIIVQ